MDVHVAIAVTIITISFLGGSIFGFGSALVAVPLLTLMLGVRDAVTLVLIFQACMGLILLKAYANIDWKVSLPMLPGVLVGTVIGTLLLSSISAAALQILLAVSIALFLIKTLWFDNLRWSKKRSVSAAATAGLGGGLFQGAIGTGGPIWVMYASTVIHEKITFRATLVHILFVSSVIRIGISIPEQLFSAQVLSIALVSLPFFLLAILLGQQLQQKVSEKAYRAGMYLILGGSSLALFIKGLS